MACPYNPRHGYTTASGREDWLKDRGIKGKEAKKISSSLVADPDPTAPLYYWQVYSLIGPDAIYELVGDFYRRVYADDEEPWFRDAFTRISGMDHHVATQAGFWIDTMGGGRTYHGGDYRLNFHHTHNAREVMTARGAQRWMHHMSRTLNSFDFSRYDARVKACIVDFLATKMRKYASQHNWKFSAKDFDFAKDIPVPVPRPRDDMGVDELKNLIARAGLDSRDCLEKADLRQRAEEAWARGAGAPHEGMGVKDLKALIRRAGMDSAGCVEKADLRRRAEEAFAQVAAAGSRTGGGAGAADTQAPVAGK